MAFGVRSLWPGLGYLGRRLPAFPRPPAGGTGEPTGVTGGGGAGWGGADAGQGAALGRPFGWLPRGADSLGPF